MDLSVGMIVHGKVTKIMKFGAFVALEGGKSGLVHISEVSGGFVNDIHDFLTEGQEIDVKVISVMPDGKINLSIKQTQSVPNRAERTVTQSAPRTTQSSVRSELAVAPKEQEEPSFEDKLKKFMSTSEGKMSDLNRHMEGKRRRR